MTPQALLVTEVELAAVMFARIGACLMVLPGIGERTVPPRIRLAFALALSLLLAPLHGSEVSKPMADAVVLATLIQELLFGLALGLVARFVLAALNLAGTVIAMQSALSAAAFFDPHEGTQSSITSGFLTTAGITLMLVADGHHLLLSGLAGSYGVQPLLAPYPLGDMSELLARMSAEVFTAGIRIALPVLVITSVSNLTFGLLNRLVPGIQVFFVAMPLQILLALGALLAGFAAGGLVFLETLDRSFAPFGG